MSDPFSDAAFNINPQATASNKHLHNLPISYDRDNKKFPRIDRDKQSPFVLANNNNLGKLHSKNNIKSNTKLPNIRADNIFEEIKQKQQQLIETKLKQQSQMSTNVVTDKLKIKQKSQGDDFKSQIQKKLKLLFQKQNNNDNLEQASQSEEDFEKQIQNNRQRIKKQRLKRQLQIQNFQQSIDINTQKNLNQNSLFHPAFHSDRRVQTHSLNKQDFNQKISHFNNNVNPHQYNTNTIHKNYNVRPKNKVDSLYQKRIKDYRDEASGNKFLIKKKQIINQKQQNQLVTKKQLTNQQIELLSENTIYPQNVKQKIKDKRKNKKQVIKKIHKSINDISKNTNKITKQEDLFQNLHNILLNPTRKSEGDIGKLKDKRTRQQLQQQFKKLQRKLVQQRKSDLQLLQKLTKKSKKETLEGDINKQISQTVTGLNRDQNTMSWRKIQVFNSHLSVKKSNFDEQVERVTKHFQQNQKLIQKYIQNQRRLLMNTNLLKKIKKQKQQQNVKLNNQIKTQ